MTSRGNFWPDLHNLHLSFESEGDAYPDRLDHILRELDRFPPEIRHTLAADLSELSTSLFELATLVIATRVQTRRESIEGKETAVA